MSDKEKTRSKGVKRRPDKGPDIPSWAAPWAITATAMPAALVTHPLVTGDPTITALMGAGSLALTAWTHQTWKNRHEHTRSMATVIVGAVTGWFTLAATGNPLDPEMVKAWVFGSVTLSLAWDLRHFAMSPHHEHDKAEGQPDPLFKRVSALAGARTRKIKETSNRVSATVQLVPGEGTLDDVTAAKGRIASAVGMDASEVTVTPVKGRADRVKLDFEPAESANAIMEWTGPSKPGQSVAAGPLIYGARTDGSLMGLWMCGDDETSRPTGNTLVTGAPNAGKTEALKNIIVEGRSRRDFCAVVGDPDKFEQSFGEIADTLSVVAKGPEQTKRLVRNLVDAIRYRAELLGTLPRDDGTVGYGQWEPECWTKHRIPVVLVDIEEATTVLASVDDEFDTVIRLARSVGIHVVASLQTAHNQNMDRRTRGLFANALAFGCREDFDAKFTLSKSTLEAGADPTKWGSDNPGKHYAEAIGTPRELWPVEGRAYKTSRSQKRAELEASRNQAATLDEGTYRCLSAGIPQPGTVPAARTPVTPASVPPRPRQEADPTDPFAEDTVDPDDPFTEDPEYDPFAETDQVRDLETRRANDEGSEIDISQSIPVPNFVGTLDLRPGRDEVSTAEARKILEDRLDELEAGGTAEISFQDLADLPGRVHRSRQWVYGELKRLVQEGRLEATGDKPPYVIRPRMLNGHRAQ